MNQDRVILKLLTSLIIEMHFTLYIKANILLVCNAKVRLRDSNLFKREKCMGNMAAFFVFCCCFFIFFLRGMGFGRGGR